nr:hypothetical protein [Tanacetum cinerariifolium]
MSGIATMFPGFMNESDSTSGSAFLSGDPFASKNPDDRDEGMEAMGMVGSSRHGSSFCYEYLCVNTFVRTFRGDMSSPKVSRPDSLSLTKKIFGLAKGVGTESNSSSSMSLAMRLWRRRRCETCRRREELFTQTRQDFILEYEKFQGSIKAAVKEEINQEGQSVQLNQQGPNIKPGTEPVGGWKVLGHLQPDGRPNLVA